MTKSEFVNKYAEKFGVSKKAAGEAFDNVFEVVVEALKEGEDVSVPALGTFKHKVTKERKGINPRTKEEVVIPSKKTVAFKAGKALKDSLNK